MGQVPADLTVPLDVKRYRGVDSIFLCGLVAGIITSTNKRVEKIVACWHRWPNSFISHRYIINQAGSCQLQNRSYIIIYISWLAYILLDQCLSCCHHIGLSLSLEKLAKGSLYSFYSRAFSRA